MRHGVHDGRDGPPRNPTETTMFAKTLVLALVLAGPSLAFVADASARPSPGGWQAAGRQGDTTRPERHDPTNTNGN
jgi:hypothetical protein